MSNGSFRPRLDLERRTPLEPPKSFSLEPRQPLNYDALGLANFGFVSADLWRGAAPTAEGYSLLARSHVATVINLQESDEADKIPPGIVYTHLGGNGL